ncbi:MAG: hypothetical protein ACFFAY_14870, partial [Promethearchaeota archaeon]
MRRWKGALLVTTLTMLFCVAMLPSCVSAALPGIEGLGPYVDKIRFETVIDNDEQILSLLNNETDSICDEMSWETINQIEGAEG